MEEIICGAKVVKMDKSLQVIANKLDQILVVLIDNSRSLQHLNRQINEFLSILEIKSYEEDKNDEDIEDQWKADDDS